MRIKEFIKILLSDNNKISSKRILSLYFALLFTIVVIVHLTGVIVSKDVIWALVALIGAGYSMGTIEKFKKGV